MFLLEQAAIKQTANYSNWLLEEKEALRKWIKAGKDPAERRPAKEPRRKQVKKVNTSPFLDACVQIVMGDKLESFLGNLPEDFRHDRLFGVVLMEAAQKLVAIILARKIRSMPKEEKTDLPTVAQKRPAMSYATSQSISSDLGSEVHRFIGAGIHSITRNARLCLNRMERKDLLEREGKKRSVWLWAQKQ